MLESKYTNRSTFYSR